MPIQLLPELTSKTLRSSLALHNAVSIVKELVDNALDARASAVTIEISTDTITTIQVKDNGTGIDVEGRQLICKPACTSKIRTVEDLATLGGSSLGFRGEALASTAELSEYVEVTTRVDGEPVGSLLRIGPNGKLLNSSSASHPVGTTFRVHNILTSIPVRKQNALKNAAKTLSAIKKLLFAYAFARPNVRLSFKVLKSKNDKANWSFAPVSDTSQLITIVGSILGKEIANQCVQETASVVDEELPDTEWKVEGSLLSIEADHAQTIGAGQYISIDGRLVSADVGTMKDIVKMYKSFLQENGKSDHSISVGSKPFIYLKFTCPPATYDVNIEPTKDDLHFNNPAQILRLTEAFFTKIYDQRPSQISEQKTDHTSSRKSSGLNTSSSFDLLLARKDNTGTRKNDIDGSSPFIPVIHTTSNKSHTPAPRLYTNMHNTNHKSLFTGTSRSEAKQQNGLGEDGEGDFFPASVANPWSLARKSNLDPAQKALPAVSQTPTRSFDRDITTLVVPDTLPAAFRTPVEAHRVPLRGQQQSPTPIVSPFNVEPYQNPGPPMRRRTKYADNHSDYDSDASVRSETLLHYSENHTALDKWVGHNRTRDVARPIFDDVSVIESAAGEIDNQEVLDQRIVHSDLAVARASQCLVRRPFKAPGKISTFFDKQTTFTGTKFGIRQDLSTNPLVAPVYNRRSSLGSSSCSNASSHETFIQQSSPVLSSPNIRDTSPTSSATHRERNAAELRDILDFEQRKREIVAQHRRGSYPTSAVHVPAKETAPSQMPWAMNGFLTYGESSKNEADGNGSKSHNSKVTLTGDHEARFGDGQEITADTFSRPAKQKPKPNPHQNRYLAAVRNLSGPPPGVSSSQPSTTLSGQSPDSLNTTPSLRNDDPRAYLIRHQKRELQSQRGATSAPGSGEATGLRRVKLTRPKSAKLPFETIPAGTETRSLVLKLSLNEDHRLTSNYKNRLGKAKEKGKDDENRVSISVVTVTAPSEQDKYMTTGQNEFAQWSKFIPDARDIQRWQTTLDGLVRHFYRAMAPIDETDTVVPTLQPSPELDVEPSIEVDLAKTIRAHINTFSLYESEQCHTDIDGVEDRGNGGGVGDDDAAAVQGGVIL